MKTIIYNIINELTDESYIEILRILPSLNIEGIKEDDLVFYPLNIDAIKSEKRFLISANKIAYKYLENLDYKIEKILEEYNISYYKKEIEKNEKYK